MLRKVLIANRGEIAVRILRACREMHIQTVAVYSDVDRGALHVRHADEAYCVGRAPARDSYLRIDGLIEVARKSGADAVHPGYGFLAENPDFAAACAEAGITFVGPPAAAIAAMGDKVAARRLMQDAGVPIIPGTATDLSDDEILSRAHEIGFPLFVKAVAGGGGKGMRLVHSSEELERVLGSARREALGAFGDDRVYLEKAVRGAHHVEIQILADGHGDLIHLGERECSIQRRHQKLVEEAPSPTVDRALRQRMAQAALRAAAAVGYVNAGTVEFLLGADGTFYFLEMNTRLQVEHPTTESITGVDIVKEQLRIAAGEPLRCAQEDVQLEGWSIECRITAEDPFNSFLPSGGHIVSLSEPSGPGIRVDSGMYEGLSVSSHYDPLLAKLVAWGSTREEALCRMRRALEEYRVIGLQTSIPFHKEVLETQCFIDGDYDTSFLDQSISMRGRDHRRHQEIAAITATLLHHSTDKRKKDSSPADGRSQPKLWKLTARREGIGR